MKNKMIETLEKNIKTIDELSKPLITNSRYYKFYDGMKKMIIEEIEKLKSLKEVHEDEIKIFQAKLDTYIENEICR